MDEAKPGKIEDLMLHVLCIDHTDGRVLWQKDVPPKLPESERVRDHGYAASTPVTDGERLYVFFGRTGVLAFDLSGNLQWQTEVGTKTHGWGSGTSPVLYQGLVIVNASVESSDLVALDKQSGREVWRVAGMESSWNTPHLVAVKPDQWELVVSVEDKVLAFDPATGEALWECDGIQDYVCPSIVSHDGIVYVLGGRQSRALAIRAGGRGDVTSTHLLWEAKVGANVSSPVVFGDHLYWVSDRNQVAYCVNRDSGEVVYSERMRGQPYASTVVADGKLYVVTRQGGTFVLAAKPEFAVLSHNELDDRSMFNASPAIVSNKILLRSDQFLYCLQEGAD